MIRDHLGSSWKIGINRKEVDPNHDLPVEPKLLKGTWPYLRPIEPKLSKERDLNHDLPVEPTLSVLTPRTKEKLSQ